MRSAIIGAGGMGRWFARAFHRLGEVAVHDIRPARMRILGGVRRMAGLSELRDFRPDFLLNAVDIRSTVKVFRTVVPFLPAGCILADIASIKEGLCPFYRESNFPFVSFHPMFGPRTGFSGRLQRENVVIISESHPRGRDIIRRLFAPWGVKITELPFGQHDTEMAASLSLPFIASFVFAACQEKDTVPGTTHGRHHQLAYRLLGEDDHLLSEILFNPHSLRQLDRIGSRLQLLKHIIRERDYGEAEGFFRELRRRMGRKESAGGR